MKADCSLFVCLSKASSGERRPIGSLLRADNFINLPVRRVVMLHYRAVGSNSEKAFLDCRFEGRSANTHAMEFALAAATIAGLKRQRILNLMTQMAQARLKRWRGLPSSEDTISVRTPFPKLLGRPSFRLNRQSSLLPCLQSALKRPDVSVASFQKFLRQTGARALVWSSAIGHDGPILGNSGKVLVQFVQRHPDRFRYLRT
jgi:hypothetical protein